MARLNAVLLPLRLALFVTVALLGVRLWVAQGLGFGDAEALYACYALHPQPVYLDHPGLIGALARLLGGSGAPSPETAHTFTALAASAIPWLGGLAARLAGASLAGVSRSVLALSLVPEISIGLFAMSPDLLLCACWLAALAAAAYTLRSEPRSVQALLGALGAGGFAGLAMLSKASGGLLALALFIASLTRPARRYWRSVGPWAALGVAAILVAPIVAWEARAGFAMLQHRLITTQASAGFSLRNLGALLGGQLAYVTPPFLLAAVFLGAHLFRERRAHPQDAVTRLLWLSTIVPALPLVLLCLWSRVAEPHWLAPAYLALALHYGRREATVGPKLAKASFVTGAAVVLVAALAVKTPLFIHALGNLYRPRYDLINDLYAWGPGRRLLSEAVDRAVIESRQLPLVVGPHWIVCAQAHAALGDRIPVGCNTPRRDDFDGWLPRERWVEAPTLLYVTDSRFHLDPEKELPGRTLRALHRVDIRRGGVVVRTLRVARLDKTDGVASGR
jgi:hypothetical protein